MDLITAVQKEAAAWKAYSEQRAHNEVLVDKYKTQLKEIEARLHREWVNAHLAKLKAEDDIELT